MSFPIMIGKASRLRGVALGSLFIKKFGGLDRGEFENGERERAKAIR